LYHIPRNITAVTQGPIRNRIRN